MLKIPCGALIEQKTEKKETRARENKTRWRWINEVGLFDDAQTVIILAFFFMVIFTALVQKRSDFISVLKWLDALIVSRQTGRRKEKTLDTLLPVIFLTFRTHVHQ